MVFLIFVAAVAAHRHSLPRRLISALPTATEEARRRVGGTARALWRTMLDPEWHDCR